MDWRNTLTTEIEYCKTKAKEYREDEKNNTGGFSELWKGKADTHEYMAIRLQRVIDWHKEN